MLTARSRSSLTRSRSIGRARDKEVALREKMREDFLILPILRVVN